MNQAKSICEAEYLENKLEIMDQSMLNDDASNSLLSLNAISTGKENQVEIKASTSYFDEMMRQANKQAKTTVDSNIGSN